MLILKDIHKNYKVGEGFVPAIKGLDLVLRDKEFVAILGPSGCGKTTLLNIIGGLDKYTSGDLIISDKSTKEYRDSDWDAYRNSKIGFVFQSYNLISHLSVLDNVGMALALSGISAKVRKERATQALTQVGLAEQMNKRSNQLSGGQMQRVAIARALVNNPEILLADEPTGALDTETSIQIMELIKSISNTMLVVMVTHNSEIAQQYSDRIVKMIDGKIVEDTNPCKAEIATVEGLREDGEGERSAVSEGAKSKKVKKTKRRVRDKSLPKVSMSFFSAIKSSFKNLTSKKGRTIITSIAGSIGIIGIALVLSVSSGMTGFIADMQGDTLAGMPVSISQTYIDYNSMMNGGFMGKDDAPEFPADGIIKPSESVATKTNKITREYVEHIRALDSSLYNTISYSHAIARNGLVINEAGNPTKMNGKTLVEIPNNEKFIHAQYDVLNGKFASGAKEAVLIVDSRNKVSDDTLNSLGLSQGAHNIADIVGREFRMTHNDDYYKLMGGKFTPQPESIDMYNSSNATTVKIVGVIRVKSNAGTGTLSSGIGYTTALTDLLIANAKDSEIVVAQSKSLEIDVTTGKAFNVMSTHMSAMQKLGGDDTPTGASIYPKNFDSKEKIKTHLNLYNVGKEDVDKVIYTDFAETIGTTMSQMISTMTIAMSAFAAISLVVSSIMIGIITYVSVVERTKEIGIMRSLGARKKDISRIFNAETLLIGLTAGVIGVVLASLLAIPIGLLITKMIGMTFKVALPFVSAIVLVAISMLLTFIAGLIPSRIAAKKDPVVALRTE